MLKRVGVVAVLMAGLVGMAAERARADEAADAKGVMTGFLKAVQSGDDKAAKGAVTAAPEYATAVGAYLDLMLATAKLQKAAEAKFGSGAAKTFGAISGPALDARLKSIDAATVKIAGESAIVTLPEEAATQPAEGSGAPAPAATPARTIILHKSAGAWKLDGASLFNLTPEKMKATEKNVALAVKQTAISNQTIQEISAGRYAAAVDAFEKFWERSAKAARELDEPSASAPATQPVTH